MLGGKEIVRRLDLVGTTDPEMLSIVPRPEIKPGTTSVDLRLGRWFRSLRATRTPSLGVSEYFDEDSGEDTHLTREYFVPFGEPFVLHPRNFVLGITLEWIRLPFDLGGYVTGKSSLGRRGLIVETAAGLHPGFSGCLALELSNVGEVAIELLPGMRICQIFLHRISDAIESELSQFTGRRKPVLGSVRADEILYKLTNRKPKVANKEGPSQLERPR